MPGRTPWLAMMWFFVFHAILFAQASLRGRVIDEAGQPMTGVVLRLLRPDQTAISEIVTDEGGRFAFSNTASGNYRLVADKSGYFIAERQLNLSAPLYADVILSRKSALGDSIGVQAHLDSIELKDSRPSHRETVTQEQLDLLPAGNSRNFLNALPLSSSVIRDRDGQLHVRGAGSQAIQYQVDGMDVTDPVSGNVRNTISSESIENVDIIASGYAPEYGRASGGLVRVETRFVPDKWRWSVTDMMPNYSFRNRAIADFSPRLTTQGPLGSARMNLLYSVSGEYRNLFNEDLPRRQNAESRISADHLIKARYVFSDLHLASVTALLNQRRLTNFGLTRQSPVETTTDTRSHDYIVGLRDRFFFNANTLLESAFQFGVVDQETRAKGTELYRIWPNQRLGNYNVDEGRRSRRFQWNESLAWLWRTANVTHHLKTGVEIVSAAYQPRFSWRPVEFYRRDGTLFREARYEQGRFGPFTTRERGFFLQNAMALRPNLTLTYGFRTDWDDVTKDKNVAPRFGLAWYPGRPGKTRISGAIGYFYDRLLLTHLIQDQFPRRIDSVFAEDGSRILTTYMVQRIPPNRLRTPLTRNWELGIERELFRNWIVRASYMTRSGRRELRQIDTAPRVLRDKEIWLEMTNTGVSEYKAFDVSTESAWKNVRLSASYTWSRSMQSLRVDPFALNIYESAFEVAPTDWDTPHRFVGWAMFPFFQKSRAGMTMEVRSGFPFSVRDDFTQIIGNRNSYRFPAYFSLGLSFEREFPFTKKYRIGVRLSGFNLTNHFNPAFVDSNLMSPEFLQFSNSPRPSGNIRLRLIKR